MYTRIPIVSSIKEQDGQRQLYLTPKAYSQCPLGCYKAEKQVHLSNGVIAIPEYTGIIDYTNLDSRRGYVDIFESLN